MVGYQVHDEETSMDFQYWLDYAIDHERHTPPAMRPCRNPACTNSSYALYCSTACFAIVEPEVQDEPDEDDFYSDGGGVLLGNRTLADTQHDLDGESLAALVCGYGPQPAPVAAPAPAFSEAPVSCTVKGLHHGQDTMITIRGTDFASVQAQLEAACAWFDAPATPLAQSTAVETGEGWCHIHNTQMTFHKATNGGKDWWSHRQGVDFCKGIAKGGRRG